VQLIQQIQSHAAQKQPSTKDKMLFKDLASKVSNCETACINLEKRLEKVAAQVERMASEETLSQIAMAVRTTEGLKEQVAMIQSQVNVSEQKIRRSCEEVLEARNELQENQAKVVIVFIL